MTFFINLCNHLCYLTGAVLTLNHELTGHKSPVSGCDFSPDCKQLATGSFDKTIIIWDPVSKSNDIRWVIVYAKL